MTNPLGPTDPGAQDECATCGHARWRHHEVDGQPECTEYVDCACGGHFVELPPATRMARVIEAAGTLAGEFATFRTTLQNTLQALHGLHTAMKVAGLLPEDPDTQQDAARGRHAADPDDTQVIPALQHNPNEEPMLCDGCGRTDQPVTATDDGRALVCPDCLPAANANIARDATPQPPPPNLIPYLADRPDQT